MIQNDTYFVQLQRVIKGVCLNPISVLQRSLCQNASNSNSTVQLRVTPLTSVNLISEL